MKPNPIKIILRGIKKRCPHCGKGELYHKWNDLRDYCGACGIKFLRNQGDPWAFLLFFDRFFLIPPIIAIYFGILPRNFVMLSLIFIALGAVFFVTTPHRYGLCISLDYLTRVYWGDLADKLPAGINDK